MRLTFILLCGQAIYAQAVPATLQPPAGQALILQWHGKGKQIYSCQNAAWKLKAPDAQLFDTTGQLAGRHFAGPTWEATDGSRITGKMLQSVPSPDAGSIPWLLLTVTSHSGSGALSVVQSIQRLDTKGGSAPTTGCESGTAETSVPYEATYKFYGPLKP